jgi:hypothetical protein
MAIPPFVSVPIAGVIPFDNSTNGFVSEDVQSAIEEAFAGAVFNDKFTFHLASLSAYDKILSVSYLDVGLRTERINTVTYSSVLYPNANLIKTISWLDIGSINQRIEKEEYVGDILSPDKLRKIYSYTAIGNKFQKNGYYLELF